jgi:Curlin associated repeat
MFRTGLAVSLLSLMIGFAAVNTSAPAAAAGSVSVTIVPKGETATAIRDGLRVFSWVRRLQNRSKIEQYGSSNRAAVSQTGSGNWARIFQSGHGHAATIKQSGDENFFGIFQFGRHAQSDVTQTGDGNVGLLLQGGW